MLISEACKLCGGKPIYKCSLCGTIGGSELTAEVTKGDFLQLKMELRAVQNRLASLEEAVRRGSGWTEP